LNELNGRTWALGRRPPGSDGDGGPDAACNTAAGGRWQKFGDIVITSMLTRQPRRTRPKRPADHHRRARTGITQAARAAAVAGAVLTVTSLAGGPGAVAATRSSMTTVYNTAEAGYAAHGRWVRFVSTTLTVPPRVVPDANSGDAVIALRASCPGQCGRPFAQITVVPGGGPASVVYDGQTGSGAFQISPQTGDRLTVSIYYDRHGHNFFTATDLTRHITQTLRLNTLVLHTVYTRADLAVVVVGSVQQPAADTLLWQFADSRLTTYTGVHGTVVGPWPVSKLVETTDGTSTAAVVASPSELSNRGQDFGAWLRHQ
jgi:hypothetical protein